MSIPESKVPSLAEERGEIINKRSVRYTALSRDSKRSSRKHASTALLHEISKREKLDQQYRRQRMMLPSDITRTLGACAQAGTYGICWWGYTMFNM